jgi:hypothetical protein
MLYLRYALSVLDRAQMGFSSRRPQVSVQSPPIGVTRDKAETTVKMAVNQIKSSLIYDENNSPEGVE